MSEPKGAALPGLRSDEGATREDGTSKRPQASEQGDTVNEPKARGGAWTEERRRSDEGRRRLKAGRRRANKETE